MSGLVKRFGAFEVLRGIDLTVQRGDVYGFLGQNGAGKTTTIKVLARLVAKSEGSVSMLGRDLDRTSSTELFRRIGFLVESPAFFEYQSGLANLSMHARLLGLDNERAACRAVLARLGLEDAAERKVRHYSLGMKQRLGVAQALLGDPDLLILDEPTNGLDPAGIVGVRDLLLAEAKERGRTVFLSSHLLYEVEALCNRVGIVERGKMIAEGRVDALLTEGETVRLRASDGKRARALLASAGIDVEGDGVTLRFQGDDATAARAVGTLCAEGLDVYEMTRERRSLEDVYRDLTGKGATWAGR